MKGDGFIRVKVRHQGRATTISLDDVLFDALRHRVGGHEEAVRWLRAASLRVEDMQASGDPLVAIGKSGLSRLIQRLAVQYVANSPARAAAG